MKKRILWIAILFGALASTLLAQTTVTPNIGLQVPGYNQANWQVPINYDLQRLDLLLSGNLPLPNLTVTGTITVPSWTPSTPWAVSVGGTGTNNPTPIAGLNMSIIGTWPNQTYATINSPTFSGTVTGGLFAQVSGPTWSTGTGAPSGSCTTGSLYSDLAGTAGATTYNCSSGVWTNIAAGGMVYPGAGIPVSTGSAWDTSLSETDGDILAGVGGAWTKTTALPNGVTATTQTVGDNSTKVATTAFVLANAGASSNPTGLSGQFLAGPISIPNSSVQFRPVTVNGEACANSGNAAVGTVLSSCKINQPVVVGETYVAVYAHNVHGSPNSCTVGDTLGNTWTSTNGTNNGGVGIKSFVTTITVAGSSDSVIPDQTNCLSTAGQFNQTMMVYQVLNSAGVDTAPIAADANCTDNAGSPILGKCTINVTTTYPFEPIVTFAAGTGNLNSVTSMGASNAATPIGERAEAWQPSYLLTAQGEATPGSYPATITTNQGSWVGFQALSFLPQSIIPAPTVVINGGAALTLPASAGTLVSGHTYLAFLYSNIGAFPLSCGVTDSLSNSWSYQMGYNALSGTNHQIVIFQTTATAGGADSLNTTCTNPTLLQVLDITATTGVKTWQISSSALTPGATITVPTLKKNDLILVLNGYYANGQFGTKFCTPYTSSPNLQVLAHGATSGICMNYYAGVETVGDPARYTMTLSGDAGGSSGNPGTAMVVLGAPSNPVTLQPRKLTQDERGNGAAIVTDAASINFDGKNHVHTFELTLSVNTTVAAFLNFDDGQVYHFNICENATGNFTLGLPSNINFTPTINLAANACTQLVGIFNAQEGTYGTMDFMVPQVNVNGVLLGKPANLNGTTPAAGTGFTNATIQKDSSGNVSVEVPNSGWINITSLVTPTGCTVSSGVCTVGSDVASVDFSSIPASYISLQIKTLAFSSDASLNTNFLVTVNGDATANYDKQLAGFNNGTAVSGATAAASNLAFCHLPGTTATAGEGGYCTIDIDFYSNTVAAKALLARSTFYGTQGTSGTYYTLQWGGQWRGTAAINELTFADLGGGNIKAGSRFVILAMR